jgi:hypothetical protein
LRISKFCLVSQKRQTNRNLYKEAVVGLCALHLSGEPGREYPGIIEAQQKSLGIFCMQHHQQWCVSRDALI